MTICLLFVLPNIKAMRIQVSKVAGFPLFEMVYHIEPPDFKFYYKDGSKTLKYLISQNEKENQKTDIVNM